jgi:hypothetical protein
VLIELSDKELEFIRTALRDAEERYRKGEFKALAEHSAILRSKIANAIIDNRAVIV